MHFTKNYTGPTPKFDAVEDLKEWFGDRWSAVSEAMRHCSDAYEFRNYVGIAGVSGFPVEAWYDHIWGEGKYKLNFPADLARACQKAYDKGLAAQSAKDLKAAQVVYMDPGVDAAYQRGLKDGRQA